jgi:hypothetical protein
VIGKTRLYVERHSILPEQFVPKDHRPVIDCEPGEAAAIRRELRLKGYEVIQVSL